MYSHSVRALEEKKETDAVIFFSNGSISAALPRRRPREIRRLLTVSKDGL